MIGFKTCRFDFPTGATRPELSLDRAFVWHGIWCQYKGVSVKAWIPQRLDFQGYSNPVFTACIVRQAGGQIELRGRFRPLWIMLFAIPALLMVMVVVWLQSQIADPPQSVEPIALLLVLCALGLTCWYSTIQARNILVALAEATETWDVPR